MDRKPLFIAGISLFLAICATYIIASPNSGYTPLYSFRMEQQSSELHFLPTSMNTFTYTTEKGDEVCFGQCCTMGSTGGIQGLKTIEITCSTCASTCESTCPATCPLTCDTCYGGCPVTLDTCLQTCDVTCSTCNSCPTWQITCENTCNPTCNIFTCLTCHHTCYTYTC